MNLLAYRTTYANLTNTAYAVYVLNELKDGQIWDCSCKKSS